MRLLVLMHDVNRFLRNSVVLAWVLLRSLTHWPLGFLPLSSLLWSFRHLLMLPVDLLLLNHPRGYPCHTGVNWWLLIIYGIAP
jgi:hypothetical protein